MGRKMERVGEGLMDPIYGAAQIGARMNEPGAEIGAAVLGKSDELEQQRKVRQETVDTTVREREKSIQEKRPEAQRGSTDWLRVGGSIPSTMALTAPTMALGGIPGAIAGGAMSAAIQPEADTEHFGAHKAADVALGGAAGGVLGAAAKGVGAIWSAVRNPESNAIASLARAAERDGTTMDQLQARLQEIRAVRPNATIADVAGENVRGLVERIGQTPGAGVAKLAPRMTERQQQQMQRVSNDLSNLTGTRRTAFRATEQTMAARAQSASPLYEQAYTEGDKAIWSSELERLSSAPAVRSAMQSAVTTWQNNAVADGFGAMNPTMVERGGLIQFGQSIPAFPNLQFWDYTKRVLDNEIGAAVRSGENGKVRTFTRLVTMLRNELDNPAQGLNTYRAAREAWGGPSQYLDAIEQGRSILARNVSSEEMSAVFSGMSQANQEAYRIGAASAIRGAMGNDPAKLADVTKYLRSPEMRAKITAMMPSPEAAERWLQSLNYEVRASELTGQALKGSPTARRLAQQSDADTIVGDLVMSALVPHPSTIGFLKHVLGALPAKARDTLRSRSDNILIDILTTPQGARDATLAVPKSPVKSGIELSAGPLAAGAGSALGQPTAPP